MFWLPTQSRALASCIWLINPSIFFQEMLPTSVTSHLTRSPQNFVIYTKNDRFWGMFPPCLFSPCLSAALCFRTHARISVP